jgi:hypothetical protein
MNRWFRVNYISILSFICFNACDLSSIENIDSEISTSDSVVIDTLDLNDVEILENENPSFDRLEYYLKKLESHKKLHGVRLNYYNHEKFLNDKDSHIFEYDDHWFSLFVHKNGLSYLGIYEDNKEGVFLRYARIEPELEMEGDTYVNYHNEPWYEYFFEKNTLKKILYNEPEKQSKYNVYQNYNSAQLKILVDSLSGLFQSFFYLDYSNVNFMGKWKSIRNQTSMEWDVRLKQIGSFVYGNYCANTTSLGYCECKNSVNMPCQINGFIYEDTLFVEYSNHNHSMKGHAKLFFNEENMVWQSSYLLKESSLPEKFILIKE